MGYFNGDTDVVSQIDAESEEALQKALNTGNYGTDSATFINGRALIPEDLESTVVNVVAKSKEDCKILNSLKKTPVKSTVHEYNRRTETGDYRFLSVGEGGGSPETNQAVERAHVNIKYLQTRRSVTKQMETVDSFENALAEEKLCGVETIVKGVESMLIHGNSDVVPTEFDGFITTLKKAKNSTITDFRGATIGTKGEEAFDEIARQVWEKNGDLDKVMFPSVLSKDIKELFTDRLRLNPLDNQVSFTRIPDYPTAIGATLRFAGDNAGADKFYRVKGVVNAEGDTALRPKQISSVTALAGAAGSATSLFGDSDAGDYKYTVHAVNAYGISAGKDVSPDVAVTKGQKVTLTITPDLSGPRPTGYIICRSAKDGTVVMEMTQIADSGASTTTFDDLNKELPGTASMLFLPKPKIINPYELAQLLPATTYPLYPVNKAETPFLILFYGALEVKAPEYCGMFENVHYEGGL